MTVATLLLDSVALASGWVPVTPSFQASVNEA